MPELHALQGLLLGAVADAHLTESPTICNISSSNVRGDGDDDVGDDDDDDDDNDDVFTLAHFPEILSTATKQAEKKKTGRWKKNKQVQPDRRSTGAYGNGNIARAVVYHAVSLATKYYQEHIHGMCP